MHSLKQLAQQVYDFCGTRNWYCYHAPKDLAMGVLVEAGELAEHFLYFQDKDLHARIKKNKLHIADEMSDVLFWLLLMSAELDIDLEAAFQEKMKKTAVKYPLPIVGQKVGKPFSQ